MTKTTPLSLDRSVVVRDVVNQGDYTQNLLSRG
jgi:hypothetical protein